MGVVAEGGFWVELFGDGSTLECLTFMIVPDTKEPVHPCKTQPKPRSGRPPPDQREPTRRYCNLANELGARAPGQWAMVPDAQLLVPIFGY